MDGLCQYDLVKTTLAYQLELFAETADVALTHARFNGRSGAFVDNMSLPVHRWYRYSADFSADWVRSLVQERCSNTQTFSVLDPFAGVGTALVACEAEHVQSWGYETHPFIHRVSIAKLRGIHSELAAVRDTFSEFLNSLPSNPSDLPTDLPPLLSRCYAKDSLAVLFAMRGIFQAEFDQRTPETELLWLAITSILRSCSGAGTAQWQYVLPNKSKSGVLHPINAFQAKATEILQDIEHARRNGWSAQSRVLLTDARAPQGASEIEVDAVITSPPTQITTTMRMLLGWR